MTPAPASAPARVVQVGASGFGRVHRERIAAAAERGEAELVAVVDPFVAELAAPDAGVPLLRTLPEALTAVGGADVVSIAAPIAEHAELATTALRAGADVLLEKPPVAVWSDFERLLQLQRSTGRLVQVGFQSLATDGAALLGSDALGLGSLQRVGAVGLWLRTLGYWSRSPWAGRRTLHGRPVVDGVVTNPLAHAVATALAVVGCRRAEDVAEVEVELFRANAIDADDTSVVRVRTTGDHVVTCALTLCAPVQQDPSVEVVGAHGRASYRYTEDLIEVTTAAGTRTQPVNRTDPLANLLAARRDEAELMVPLDSTGAFMRVMAAVGETTPTRIDPGGIRWPGEGVDRHAEVDDVEHWVREAVRQSRTFTELGAPWAHPGRDRVLARAELSGTEVAVYHDGGGTVPTSSPRPVLHPVRTRAGVAVSSQRPGDHDWHAGVGIAVSDVDGTNFWGGRSFRPGDGSRWRDDHGTVTGPPPVLVEGGLEHHLDWLAPDGSRLLAERRLVRWADLDEDAWRLTLDVELSSEQPRQLASSGSKGRPDGGYGGFFWRFPDSLGTDVLTADARGEDEVHGSVSPWIAWSADFAAGDGNGPAAVLVRCDQAAAAGEPWFVRVRDYPGLGSALAWEQPLTLEPGRPWHRRFEIAVVDGRLDRDRAAALASRLDG